jgi:hypothetical protein
MAQTRRRQKRYLGIDVEAAGCVDFGHSWLETYFGHARGRGALRGIPVRIVVCDRCNSTRLDYVGWDGTVISRRYWHDPAYLDNARALSDDMHQRRRALREAKVARFKAEGERGEWE